MTVRQHESPHVKLKPPADGSVRWTDGFWAERFALCRDVMIHSMGRALAEPENGAVLSNFAVAAGLEEGRHLGTNWSDGDCYKWIEAVSHVYAVTADATLGELMDEAIDTIARAQEADGYICTQIQLTDRERWQDLHHHELYNMGHLLTAACVHHRATGKDTFMAVARKLGDYLWETFGPRPPELAHFGFNPSNIMGAVDLYRATGDSKYLDLAGVFVDMRGSQPGGTDINQTRRPLREETEAVGHSVTATYLYAGAADVFAETGDGALMEALERIWHNVVERRMYVHGGVAALHFGVSTRNDPVHEAFGFDYQLPNRTAYNETCANIGSAMWNQRMLGLTGQARFADVMELVLYNCGLSAVDLEGTRFCYTNPMRRLEGLSLLSQDSPGRWFTFRCYCCPPQVARTLARLHEWAYSVSGDAVWVNLYGGSTLATDAIKLTQTTDYPWDGTVTITIDQAPDDELALMLRVPGWADGAAVAINGEAADAAAKPGSYASLKRRWRPGDMVRLELPMPVRLVEAHPVAEETRNHLCAMRGPIVYCLESGDLPSGTGLLEVHLPRDAHLTARHDADLLGGVTVVEGQGVRVPAGDWEGRLYRTLWDSEVEPVPLTLVPYYAWGNRGPGEMTVWLPIA